MITLHVRIRAALLGAAGLIAGLGLTNAQPANSQRQEAAPKALFPDAGPVCPCESLAKVAAANTTIESAALDPSDGSCRVTAIVTHPPTQDRVKVFIALPVKGWNGRFRGNGG